MADRARINEPLVRWRIEDDMRLPHGVVAQYLGISAPYWSQLLSGERNPSDEHLEALEKLLKVNRRLLTAETVMAAA